MKNFHKNITKRFWFLIVILLLLVIGWLSISGFLGRGFFQLFTVAKTGESQTEAPPCNPRPSRAPEMVVVPAGKFLMGSPESDLSRNNDESPQHEVEIPYPFAIGRCEVTFAEYKVFTEATGRRMPDDEGWGRRHQPVINVSWEDAIAYAQWLSNMTGRRYRLPSEAEWEYAARAGTNMAYWWGNDIKKGQANCLGCGSRWDGKQTASVGSFSANPFGLYDTAGNVWEWVQDCWHENYQNAPADGRAWEMEGGGDCGRRVVRGGSWSDVPRNLIAANRNQSPLRDSGIVLGFRLAQDIN